MIDVNSLEIFKQNTYNPTDIGMVSNNAYLSIVVTNKCQCQCRYCINSETDHTLSLPVSKAIKNIKKLVEKYGIKEAILLGGEPLLHKDLFTLIKRLRTETGLQMVRLTTNGIRLRIKENSFFNSGTRTGEFYRKLFDKDYGIQGINISWHNNEDFLNYEELSDVILKIKDVNPDIKIRINSNIWRGNLDNLEDLLWHFKLLENIGADECRISNIIPKDSFSVNEQNDGLDMILSDNEYIEIFNEMIEHYSKTYTLIENKNTLGFVRYILVPAKMPIIINWNIGSIVSEQVCENDIANRQVNTFKCLVSGNISLSWNETNKIDI